MRFDLSIHFQLGGNKVSKFSRELAALFRAIDDDRQTTNQIKLYDAGLLQQQGPVFWEGFTALLDKKCAELNAEPDMRKVKLRVDTNVLNAVTLRRTDINYTITGIYDPKRYTINFTHTENGAYKLTVTEGA